MTRQRRPPWPLRDQDYDDDQLLWQRKNGEEVVIHFATKGLTTAFLNDVKKGVESWDRSPCVQPRLTETCAPQTNCVTIGLKKTSSEGDDGNFDAIEKATLNVVKHEMGHAIGLRHCKTKGVLMHGDTNKVTEPDRIDYDNLLVLYGRQ
ncbi:matrixin family metalloprotease [Allokutzneria sp. NRRL B-24872]|uniref:matrixin family metalloprotease n=1 Tax=Allokutzneria sp. NRRL B-24872 TaxID=1137961 RepID=UPI00143D2462|nr:matrixin family metalloprotease [Allokutzneria sp. NRRL B-24872]